MKLGKRTSTKKKEVKINSGTIKASNLISTSLVSRELMRTLIRLPDVNLLCNRHPKCLKDLSKRRRYRMKSHGISRCYKVKRYKMRIYMQKQKDRRNIQSIISLRISLLKKKLRTMKNTTVSSQNR